jgi:hypothetical protein
MYVVSCEHRGPGVRVESERNGNGETHNLEVVREKIRQTLFACEVGEVSAHSR